MLDIDLSGIATQLKQAIGGQRLRALGQDSGFVIRERDITADRFVPSLIKALGSHTVESIADLVRDFNYDHDLAVHYKPYYEKLDTPCFPRLMHAVYESLLTHLCAQVLQPLRGGPFARFRDIYIQDGTSFALHDGLAPVYPGRFSKVSPAAVELHATMSLFGDNVVTLTMTPDTECERHHLPHPDDLRDVLLMADRGYDSMDYMQAVDDAAGFFLIRGRKSLDPVVINIKRRGQRYRALEGQRLSYVLAHVPKDKVLDMDVCRQVGAELKSFFRVVARWNPAAKEWVRLFNNLHRDEFSAEQILQAYRLRWQIELLFKELKSYANLHKFSTTKPQIAEGLIWASLCAAFLKRHIAHACQQLTGAAISTRRVAMCGHHLLDDICRALTRGTRTLAQALNNTMVFLAHNARRSNQRRDRESGRLALGISLAGAEA
jgi:hypothetical protein